MEKRLKKSRKKLSILSKQGGRPFFSIPSNFLSNKNYLRLDISFFSNNIFCSIKDIKLDKLLCLTSCGKYKIKVSKKNIKYASNLILVKFFKELKDRKIHFTKPLVLVLVAPSNLRKGILLKVLKYLKYVKNKRFLILVKPKKVFNGCRAKKQIRKKQKGHVVYK